MAKDDKLKGKPRSVRAAQKAGSKYFFDKNGVKKLAVTAEQLKKTGLTLRQWANQTDSSGKLKKKPESGIKVKKPESGIKVKKPDGKITVTKVSTFMGGRGDGKAEVKKRKVDLESPSNKAKDKAILKKPSGRMASNTEARSARARESERGFAAMSRFTEKQYNAMSVKERKAKGLPGKLDTLQTAAKIVGSPFKKEPSKKIKK